VVTRLSHALLLLAYLPVGLLIVVVLCVGGAVGVLVGTHEVSRRGLDVVVVRVR
jgi:hypothetical protein